MNGTAGLPPSIRCQFVTYGPLPGQRDRCPLSASVFRNGGWYCQGHDPLHMLLEHEEAEADRLALDLRQARRARREASTPAERAQAKKTVQSLRFRLLEQRMMVDQYKSWIHSEDTGGVGNG